MLLQNFLVKYNYNIAMAITAYNYGENYLSQVINKCSEDTGICITELNGLDNLEWLSYRYIISNGDASYLENVFKYIPDGTILEFRTISGNTIKIKYENINTYNQNIQKY